MKLDSSFLIEGMKLLEDVIINDKTIIKKDTTLTNEYIELIKENVSDKVSILIGDKYNTFSGYFDNLIDSIIKSNNIDKIIELSKVLAEIVKNEEVLQYDLSSYLRENYNHLINTIKISVILAKKYNDTIEKNKQISIENVALSAILEDIGRNAKYEEVLELINKQYKSDIEELMEKYPNIKKDIFIKYDSKFHPVYSYLITKDLDIDKNVRLAVLFHHEKESGDNSLLDFPLSTHEEAEYVDIARIIKLADLYDILVHTNVEKNYDNPFGGIGKQIDKMVASNFVNAKLTNILKTVIPIFQVGTKVILSDGTKGIVESNDPNDYNNPELVDLNGEHIDLNNENIIVIKHFED